MLTREQIQANIEALEKQGASQSEIQEWLNSLPKQSSAPQPEEPKKEGIFKKVGKALISSERKFGQSIADALPSFVPGSAAWTNKQNEILMAQNQDIADKLTETIKEKLARGEDTSHLDKVLREHLERSSKPPIDINETNPSINKSAKQIFGEGLGVAVDIASFGTYGNAAKGAKAGQLLVKGKASQAVGNVLGKAGIGTTAFQKTVPTAANRMAAFGKGFVEGVKTSAPIGVGYGASASMQADDDTPTIFKKALSSGVISGIVGGVLSGAANMRNVSPDKLKEEAIADYKKGLAATKEKYKEQADKVIPELLDEGTWGTRKKLLEKAEKGLKLSKEEYKKLGELQGMAEVDGLLDKIDDEINKYSQGGKALTEKTKMVTDTIDNHINTARQLLDDPAMAKKIAKAGGQQAIIDNARKEVVAQLRYNGMTELGDMIDNMDMGKMDDVDEYVRTIKHVASEYLKPKPISVNSSKIGQLKKIRADIEALRIYNQPNNAYQEDLRQLAQDYGDVVYETRKSIKTVDDNNTLSQVRKLDTAIRDLLNTNNPEYAKINKIYTLNSRLFDILDETAKRREARPLVSWFNAIVGSGGATVGGTTGGFIGGPVGSTIGSLTGGSLAVGLTSMLNSTWYNTMRAVQKSKLADKLLEVGSMEVAKYWVRLLNAKGTDAVNQFLNTPTEQLNQPSE